jgi:hypothetical protein
MSGILSDMAKGIVKEGVSLLVPGCSPFISILDGLKSGVYQRRFEDFQAKVDEQLSMMKDVQLQQLMDNQKFATVVFIAGQLALKTDEIKRKLLANAVVKTPSCTLTEDSVVILLNCIEKYTIPHLRLLRFLQNPKEYNPRDSYMGGSPMTIYDDYYPNRDKSLDNIVIRDLFADGLINTDSLNTTVSSAGMVEKRTTKLGDDMIYFFGIEKM